jgi:hypothetical protein
MMLLYESLSEWRLADPSLMLQHLELRKTGQGISPSRWTIRDGISPVALYTYLKARFGDPNGFQMVLKSPSSNNYIHWHWSLQWQDHVIEFMGFNLHAEIYVSGTPEPSADEQQLLIDAIKADFAAHGPSMSVARKSLEKWAIFINPYFRLRRVVDKFSLKLQSLNLESVPLPELPMTPDQLMGFPERMKESQSAYTEALGLGLALRMISPVLAESFINLVIFLLAKPETKSNERMLQDVIRKEIDLRVHGLHLWCDGFEKPIDVSAEAFKNFLTVMNGRNDFLHGNINPMRLKYDTVFFDGTIPLPERYEDFSQLALVNSLIGVTPDSVLSDVNTVNRFIEYVLSHLAPDVKDVVELFMHTSNPGWREDTKKAGVLFPPQILHGVLSPADVQH